MHRVNRNEDRGIADRGSRDAAYRSLGMPVVMNVGIIEHDLAAATQPAGAVGFAFHEAVDELAVEIARSRPLGKVEPGIADRVVNSVDVQRVPHHAVPDPVAASGAVLVAEQNDLRLIEFDTDGFTVASPEAGTFTVRIRATPYWKVTGGRGCVSETEHNWTQVYLPNPGKIKVTADFSPGARFGKDLSCDG